MPQARLPDVNTAFIKWRNKIVTALEAEKYTAALGSLNNFNACLPKEYQVKVSTDLYNEKLQDEKLLVRCNHCSENIDYRTIKKMVIVCTPIEQLITSSSTKSVWLCSLCNGENLTTRSEFIRAKLPNPYYLGIVPDPPERKDGILDRVTYHRKIEHWAWTMLGELEFKAAQFRDDSWQKAMDAGYDILSGDEEQDK